LEFRNGSNIWDRSVNNKCDPNQTPNMSLKSLETLKSKVSYAFSMNIFMVSAPKSIKDYFGFL
jgi:hypothetical protein